MAGLTVAVPEESGPLQWTVTTMVAHHNNQCPGSNNLTIDAPGVFTICPRDPGLCDAGTNPAGFALDIEGSIAVIRKCGAGQRTAYMTATISGSVAVMPN